jgi:Holliday junction resolvase RusA-like endonuclease
MPAALRRSREQRARPVTDPIEIILTAPPSTNKIWAPVRTRTGAKFVKRTEYADWSAMAKREVEAQRAGFTIGGQFRASILVPAGRHDGDNFIKPTLDACQAGGAIANDRLCIGGTWDVDDTRQGTVLIVLTPIPPVVRADRNKGSRAHGETM